MGEAALYRGTSRIRRRNPHYDFIKALGVGLP